MLNSFLTIGELLKSFFTIIGIFSGLILFCALYTYWEQNFKNRKQKVRFSNPKDLEKQCAEFIDAINSQNDFVHLIKLRPLIENYFSERPFLPAEYSMKSKVFKAYYARQNALLPRTRNNHSAA